MHGNVNSVRLNIELFTTQAAIVVTIVFGKLFFLKELLSFSFSTAAGHEITGPKGTANAMRAFLKATGPHLDGSPQNLARCTKRLAERSSLFLNRGFQ